MTFDDLLEFAVMVKAMREMQRANYSAEPARTQRKAMESVVDKKCDSIISQWPNVEPKP